MNNENIENALIESVSLSMAEHGVLTYYIGFSLANGGYAGIGGYCIGHGYLGADEFSGYEKGIEALMRIMDVVGVERWEDIIGKHISVVTEGWGSQIHKIGNIMENKWFDEEAFFKKERSKD